MLIPFWKPVLGGCRRSIGGCVSASSEIIVLAGGENVEELSRWLGGETPAAQEVGQATEEIPSEDFCYFLWGQAYLSCDRIDGESQKGDDLSWSCY